MKNHTHNLVAAAVFAAAIAAATAYILHIPLPTGGYIHVGDALLYLAASLLPLPWAMAAGAVGGALADLLTAPMWAPATFIIKPVLCFFFTNRKEGILCSRNLAAMVAAGILSPLLYALVNVALMGSWAGFAPQFLGTFVQGIGSAVVFVILGVALDGARLKQRLAHA